MKYRFSIIFLILAAMLLASCMSTSFSGNSVLEAGKTLRGNLSVTTGTVTLEEKSKVTGTILLTSGVL
jgi:predicted small secreted protein